MDIQEKESKVRKPVSKIFTWLQYYCYRLCVYMCVVYQSFLQVRSYYSAQNVTDVALYTEPEEIYLMKKNGDLKSYPLHCLAMIAKVPH